MQRVPIVLVIEDDPLQRDIYKSLLYYNGFDVEIAPDAESGLTSAFEQHPDAILVDVVLPRMNGLDATALFKNSPTTAHVPVICMSAYDIDMHKVKRAGADDFLKKPIAGDALVRSIRRFIGWDDQPKPEQPSEM